MRVGQKVKFIVTIDEFIPTPEVSEGETGTIVLCEEDNAIIHVKLDKHHPDLFAWENELWMTREEGEDMPCIVTCCVPLTD
jgi:hypothetical protein